MGTIALLDCTLGFGGALIGWNYGDKAIKEMQALLRQSRIDIVELGVLQSYQKGPHFSVSSTGELPAAFARRDGQLYAGWMASPRIAAELLPRRSAETVDIIRVPLSSDSLEEDAAYCADLTEKGYLLSVAVEYSMLLSQAQSDRILAQINRLAPWACTIIDSNGILTADELEVFFSRLEHALDPDIRIGFHGADNLGRALELAKLFCATLSHRSLILSAGIYGMSAGGRCLASEDVAEWLNGNGQKDYDLYALRFLTEYVKPYVEPKLRSGALFAYHLSATHRCDYRYVDYYLSRLQLDNSILDDVLNEIKDGDRFRFSAARAAGALRAYRKRKLNMVFVVLTADRWRAVDALLFSAALDLKRYGVDVEILDSSADEKTHAVVTNFQIDGNDNIRYRRYDGELDGVSVDRKVIAAFEANLDYDYIWVCCDGLIPRIADLYDRLLECAGNGTDYIVVDAAFRNNMHYISRTYENCLDFFTDNSARTAILGSYIFRSEAIRAVLEHQPLNDSNYSLWSTIAPLQELAVRSFRTQLIVADAFDYNPALSPPPFRRGDTMEQWGRRWYHAIKSLPDVYEAGKPSALRIQMSDFHPFHLRQLLELRGKGAFGLSVMKRYREYFPFVCDTPGWKFTVAALTPRPLARLLVKKEHSRMLSKILSLYRKI